MKIVVLSIYDIKVGAYMRPMFVPAVGAGMRMFADEVNRVESEMYKHPEDYALYRVGEFDDTTGLLVAVESRPELLATAENVIRRDADQRQMKLVN